MSEDLVQPINPDRPQFDYLTMQEEWHSFLHLDGGYDEETGPASAALIAEVVRQHSVRFTNALGKCDMYWNDLEGEFQMQIAHIGVIEPLSVRELDELWADAFNAVCEDLELIESMVDQKG